MYKILTSLLFIFITFSIAADDTYVFEAKGEFAKELKSLVEKYSKEGKIEAKVYKKEDIDKSESKTITRTVLSAFSDDTAEQLKNADISKGKMIYNKTCARCHGKNADENKYAGIRKLSTLKPLLIVELLETYKEAYDNSFGGSLRFLMKPQADHLTTDEMQSIAVYIYSLNHNTKLPISEDSTHIDNNNEIPTSYLQ